MFVEGSVMVGQRPLGTQCLSLLIGTIVNTGLNISSLRDDFTPIPALSTNIRSLRDRELAEKRCRCSVAVPQNILLESTWFNWNGCLRAPHPVRDAMFVERCIGGKRASRRDAMFVSSRKV